MIFLKRLHKSRSLRKSERQELEALRNLYVNLMSGVILNIDRDLVKLLMQKDWTDG